MIDLRAIEKVAESERHAFVYVSSMSAYGVPLFGQYEDHEEFIEMLKNAWKNRESAPPLPAADEHPGVDDRFMAH